MRINTLPKNGAYCLLAMLLLKHAFEIGQKGSASKWIINFNKLVVAVESHHKRDNEDLIMFQLGDITVSRSSTQYQPTGWP